MTGVTDIDLTQHEHAPALMVHHHFVGGIGLPAFFAKLERGEPLTALCGAVRCGVPNPLALPCCPRCAALVKEPCAQSGWSV